MGDHMARPGMPVAVAEIGMGMGMEMEIGDRAIVGGYGKGIRGCGAVWVL
jgi:hypothetical protein